MKTVGVDIRPLLDNNWGGVSWYTFHITQQLIEQTAQNNVRVVLFYNQQRAITRFFRDHLSMWKHYAHVFVAGYRVPNKFINLSMRYFKVPKVDELISLRLEHKNKQRYALHAKQLSLPIKELQKTFCVDCFILPNLSFISLSENVASISICHDVSWEIFPECFSPRQLIWHKLINPKLFFSSSAHIIAVSENTKNDLLDLYGITQNSVSTIHPGVDHSRFYPIVDEVLQKYVRKKYALPSKFILSVGTLEPRKNIEAVIEAFDLMNTRDTHLVIAGKNGWKHNTIYQLWMNAKRQNQIHFLNFVASADLPVLYSIASCFLYPSLYEGFGLPVAEAMSCGTPVIVSHGSSLPEVVGDAGLLVDPFDLSDIARAADNLLNNKKLRDTLIDKGKEQSKKFQWERTVQKILSLIDHL